MYIVSLKFTMRGGILQFVNTCGGRVDVDPMRFWVEIKSLFPSSRLKIEQKLIGKFQK